MDDNCKKSAPILDQLAFAWQLDEKAMPALRSIGGLFIDF